MRREMSEETANEKKQEKRLTVMESLEMNQDKIEKALAGTLDPVQFMSVCASAYRATPKLKQAPWESFVLACVEAAQLGLTPANAMGECYIVPRWNRNTGGQWATFLIGYRGMMKLARRSNEIVEIAPELVYENDEFHESLGTKRELHHVRWYCLGHDEPGEITHAYSTVTLKSGKVLFHVVERADLDKAASKSGDPRDSNPSNVWREWFGPMSLKTAIRRHAKFLPIPDAVKEAMMRDEYRVVGQDDSVMTAEAVEAERHVMLEDPGLKERKALASAMGKAWRRAEKFCKQAGVMFSRENIAPFHRLIMWLSSDGDPWPDDRAEQIRSLEIAIGQLDQWADAGEEGRALCMEFAQYNDSGAAYETFGEDEPFADFEEKSDPAKDDAASEASQGGEQ
jgi:recombination protein RecT